MTLAAIDRPEAARCLDVLHVIPSLSRLHGGPAFAVFAQIKALAHAEDGWTSTVVSTQRPGESSLGEAPLDEGQPGLIAVRLFAPIGSAAFVFSPTLAAWLYRHVREFD